jgi:hypothetical protein
MPPPSTAGTLTGISCPSASLCVAVDDGGSVFTSTDAVDSSPTWTRTPIDGNHELLGVSCPTRRFCLAVDNAQNVIETMAPLKRHWRIQRLHLPSILGRGGPIEARLEGVSCTTARMCAVIADDGIVASSRQPTDGARSWSTKQIGQVTALACPSASLCVAVDGNGNAIESIDAWSPSPTWTTAEIANEPTINAPPMLTAVACASASFCLATSRYGNAIAAIGPQARRARVHRRRARHSQPRRTTRRHHLTRSALMLTPGASSW